MTTIAFLCGANSVRNLIAEGLVRQIPGGKADVVSTRLRGQHTRFVQIRTTTCNGRWAAELRKETSSTTREVYRLCQCANVKLAGDN